MIVDFQLLNDDMLTIGKARLNLPIEDIKAVEIGLRAVGEAYTQCSFLKYDIYTQDNGPKEIHGEMRLQGCQEDC